MPPVRLTADDVHFVMAMKKAEYSNMEIAGKLGVTEGTIRYRIKQEQSGMEDRRKAKPSMLDLYRGIIDQWIEDYEESRRRPTMQTLYEWLHERHGYSGSYDAFRRYIRKHCGTFHQQGAWIRVETPPGALLLVDWKEDNWVQMGEPGIWVKVQALCFTLGFSRKMIIWFCEKKDLDAFIHAHQEAFRKLGGLPEVVRTDCLKSSVLQWRGSRSVLNERYQRYMERLEIEVFPARPREPQDKGKVEKRIRDLFSRMDFKHHVFKDMADLQETVERKLAECEGKWRCGATGLTVAESFLYEKKSLKPLPEPFPRLPLCEKRTRVRRDGTVYFDGNYYQVLRDYIDRSVLCINTGHEVSIFHHGNEIERFPYLPKTKGMLMLSKKAIEDPAVTLSDTVRRWGLEVARRQVGIYQEISTVGSL